VFDPVVCDLDGTLVDSGPAIVATIRQACAEVGAPVAEDRDLAFCVGPPLEETLPVLVGDAELARRAAAAYRAHYGAIVRQASAALPGAREALASLAQAGIPVAVATYKVMSLATATLEAAGLAGLVTAVVGRASPDDDRTKGELIRETLGLLVPHGGRPVYIGDHDDDEVAAAAAGVSFLRYGPLTWSDLTERVVWDGDCERPG
jgi:phosphoglycolate phosphatase